METVATKESKRVAPVKQLMMDFCKHAPQQVFYGADALFQGGNKASIIPLDIKRKLVTDPSIDNAKELLPRLLVNFSK